LKVCSTHATYISRGEYLTSFVLVFMATVAEYFIPYHEYLRAREKWKFYREQGG
jgi:hypothetical protein